MEIPWAVFLIIGSNLHTLSSSLDALVRGDDHARSAVELEQLRKDQAGGARAEQQNFHADGWREFVEPVNSACGGFKEGRIFVGKVVNLVQLLLLAEERVSMSCPGNTRTYYTT